MIDFGFDKIALIGAVALIVIGPERLPRVARTVGHLIGKAQRYVADVKAEVNRSIELDELKKMKTQFEDAARDVERNVSSEINQATSELNQTWTDATGASDSHGAGDALSAPLAEPPREYKPVKKNWRVKRGRTPMWFKQQTGVRRHVQSGAARMARHKPKTRW